MNRRFIGITIVLAGLFVSCGGASGSAAPTPAIITPTTHPYFAEETPTVLPTLVSTAVGPSAEIIALANATLTAAAAPPPGATATPELTAPLLETAVPDEPASEATAEGPESPTATSTLTPTPSFNGRPEVQPIYRAVYFRAGPGTNYEILQFLREGESVLVIARDSKPGLWYNVELESGERGWVAMSVSEPVLDAAMEDLPVAATIPAPPLPTLTAAP